MLTILVGCMFISPLAIAIGQFVYSLIALVINAYPNRKYVNYPLKNQFMDISRSLFTATSMAVVVYMIGKLPLNIYLLLGIQVLVGIILYVILAKLFNNGSFVEVMQLVKSKIHKK